MDSLAPTGKLSSGQREELMDQVKQQLLIANTQELLTKCLAMCMDRYMDSWNLVSKTYTSRLQREKNLR